VLRYRGNELVVCTREGKTMTRDKDRKRIIRNRMKSTGESYTTARRHVVARRKVRFAPHRFACRLTMPPWLEKATRP
jgi:hypothetical protein